MIRHPLFDAVVSGHDAGPIVHSEVFAQQRACRTWFAGAYMSDMRIDDTTQQCVLLSAVQQFRPGQAKSGTHCGDQPESDGRQRGDRSGLRHGSGLTNDLIGQVIGVLPAGYGHLRRFSAEFADAASQGVERERGFTAARRSCDQQHGSFASYHGVHRIFRRDYYGLCACARVIAIGIGMAETVVDRQVNQFVSWRCRHVPVHGLHPRVRPARRLVAPCSRHVRSPRPLASAGAPSAFAFLNRTNRTSACRSMTPRANYGQ
ncbi:hypothetical protein [Bifidobacterium biavatii]|uniref:hypothetical protein n=1 Tax=Bifidobacterium biavatii TaxID=762212 RepID=UPI001EE6734A|nr:hypothetical protein [Bifidobacterium biavatii]